MLAIIILLIVSLIALFYFAIREGKCIQVFISGFVAAALALACIVLWGMSDWSALIYIGLGIPAAFLIGGSCGMYLPGSGSGTVNSTNCMMWGFLLFIPCFVFGIAILDVLGLLLLALSPVVFGLGCTLAYVISSGQMRKQKPAPAKWQWILREKMKD